MMTVMVHVLTSIGIDIQTEEVKENDRSPSIDLLCAVLYWMTVEGSRLLELHSSVSVSSGMSHHE